MCFVFLCFTRDALNKHFDDEEDGVTIRDPLGGQNPIPNSGIRFQLQSQYADDQRKQSLLLGC